MRVFLDANLLIYVNTLISDQNSRLEEFYTSLLKEDLFTNLPVIDETLYLSSSKYHVSYQLTFEFIKGTVLPFASIIPMEESDISTMERYLTRYRIKPSDAIHLACMEKAGITNIASEDEEFDKIKEIKRIWIPKSKA